MATTSSGGTPTANAVPIIRPIQAGDEATVATIWRSGLSQTAEGVTPLFGLKSKMIEKMESYGDYAMSETGDVGPNGNKLLSAWGGEFHKDRVMLVAYLPETPDTIVGAIGVKKGFQYTEVEPESTVASIWRMCVDSSIQRRGVGKTLLKGAEKYAVEKLGCTTMKLWTGNEIAAKFYTKAGGFELVPGQLTWYDDFNPMPRPLEYEKMLVES